MTPRNFRMQTASGSFTAKSTRAASVRLIRPWSAWWYLKELQRQGLHTDFLIYCLPCTLFAATPRHLSMRSSPNDLAASLSRPARALQSGQRYARRMGKLAKGQARDKLGRVSE